MRVGVQFSGTVQPLATHVWITHSWKPAWHVLWTLVPTSIVPGARQLEWSIATERNNAGVTYWIKVINLTNAAVNFEGRYAIVN